MKALTLYLKVQKELYGGTGVSFGRHLHGIFDKLISWLLQWISQLKMELCDVESNKLEEDSADSASLKEEISNQGNLLWTLIQLD